MPRKLRMSVLPPFFFFLFFTATSLCLYTISAVAYPDASESNATDFIRTNCNATLYPDLCFTSLSPYASAVQQSSCQLAQVAITVSLYTIRQVSAYLTNVSTHESYFTTDSKSSGALHDCCSNLRDAVYQTVHSLKQIRQLGVAADDGSSDTFKFLMSNVQTWMSAALTDEETCTDGFQDVQDQPLKNDVCHRMESVKKLTSNALALVNVYASKGMEP